MSRNQSSKERLVGMWVGKLSVFKKRGNDQRGWSPARRGKSDVTWSWSGGGWGREETRLAYFPLTLHGSF